MSEGGWYEQYLASPQWRLRRERALRLAFYRCQSPVCPDHQARLLTDAELASRSRYRLEVHHLTYARVGRELDDDLIVLCADCHAAIHGLPSLPRRRDGFVTIGAVAGPIINACIARAP